MLYHRTEYDWTADELELCTTFANQMAIAVANARLFNSVRAGAARLRAIQELSSRLNRIQDVGGIGEAIVAEADKLIGHDTIRVYRVDHVAQICEPIAFQGEFAGIGTPSSRTCGYGSARGSPAGSRSTTRASGSAMRRPTSAGARSARTAARSRCCSSR